MLLSVERQNRMCKIKEKAFTESRIFSKHIKAYNIYFLIEVCCYFICIWLGNKKHI